MSAATADAGCVPVAWRRSVAEALPPGVRPAVVVGGWLALTVLFLVGGAALVGTAVTAAGRVPAGLAGPVAVVGTVGVAGLSPTLARVIVAGTVARLRTTVDLIEVAVADGCRFVPRATAGAGHAACCA